MSIKRLINWMRWVNEEVRGMARLHCFPDVKLPPIPLRSGIRVFPEGKPVLPGQVVIGAWNGKGEWEEIGRRPWVNPLKPFTATDLLKQNEEFWRRFPETPSARVCSRTMDRMWSPVLDVFLDYLPYWGA